MNMSHEVSYEITPFERLSLEEQIEYVEANLEMLVSRLMKDESIPYWHREILADRLARFRSETEGGIPWEEFQKELEQI